MSASRKVFSGLATVVVAAVTLGGLSACATEEEAASGGNGTGIQLDSKLVAAAKEKAADIVQGQKLDGSLEIINENGGREGAILQAAFAPFEEATGVRIKFTGTTDYLNVVSSRVKAGNAPDIVSSNVGAVSKIMKDTQMLDLTEVIGEDTLKSNFSESTLESASIDGRVRGIYQGFSNFMLWYNPQNYKGPLDGTWADVTQWTAAQAAAGKTPWCIAEEAGPATGAVASQWVQQLFAKKYGAELSRKWGTGELPWTSAEVKSAFQLFGEIAANDKNVNGGVAGSLSESFATGANGLIAEPAKCDAVMWGTWTASLMQASTGNVEPEKNLDFVRVPASEEKFAKTEAFSAQPLFALKDTPATRAFMKYIASSEEQALLASADNWTVSNTKVPSDVYPSKLLKKAAKTFFSPDTELAVGPSTLASAAVSTAFWQGLVQYLKDPASLDQVLATIQKAQEASTT